MFENLVISDKCKTLSIGFTVDSAFENLVISDKCKTVTTEFQFCSQFESLVIFYKCKNFVIIEVFEGLALRAPF